MSLVPTLLVLISALLIAALANWLERRPRPLGDPSLVPWIAVQMVAVIVAILMLAHVVSLMTGYQLRSRFGI